MFYRLYFIIQRQSHENFNVLILLGCNFNNFVTSAKHMLRTVWRWCRCIETWSAYGIKILFLYIYMFCAFVGMDNKPIKTVSQLWPLSQYVNKWYSVCKTPWVMKTKFSIDITLFFNMIPKVLVPSCHTPQQSVHGNGYSWITANTWAFCSPKQNL
jgi:hypothetical protein